MFTAFVHVQEKLVLLGLDGNIDAPQACLDSPVGVGMRMGSTMPCFGHLVFADPVSLHKTHNGHYDGWASQMAFSYSLL